MVLDQTAVQDTEVHLWRHPVRVLQHPQIIRKETYYARTLLCNVSWQNGRVVRCEQKSGPALQHAVRSRRRPCIWQRQRHEGVDHHGRWPLGDPRLVRDDLPQGTQLSVNARDFIGLDAPNDAHGLNPWASFLRNFRECATFKLTNSFPVDIIRV